MRNTRIYVNQALHLKSTIFLDTAASHHVRHVLRLKIGDVIVVFDGQGHEYEADIIGDKKQVQIMIQHALSSLPVPALHIHLGQAISRGEKMDFTLQKSVELGIKEITPLFTERCGVKLSGERLQAKLQHWQKVVIGACEQSGRSDVPHIYPPVSLSIWLEQAFAGVKLLLHPIGAKRLKEIPPPDSPICLLIGSEGGFSTPEVLLAQQFGFESIRLGPRILRTETAALAAITALQCLWGDMR
jgi:16S rRNA (uracil1498-N3)-methyltransferase